MSKPVDTKPLVDYDGVLDEKERRRILARVDSMFSWVGAAIPREIEVDGERIPLKGTIEELIMKKELDRESRARISKLLRALHRKEESLKDLIRDGDITEDQAVEIYDEIKGIVRALSKLRKLESGEDPGDADVEKQTLMKKVDDEKRWKKFLEGVD
jgi:hypothetical protein